MNKVKRLIFWSQNHSTYNVLFTIPLLFSVVFWSEDSEAFLHHPPGPAKAEDTNTDCKLNSQEVKQVTIIIIIIIIIIIMFNISMAQISI